jgi:hypothetical protein
VKSEHILYSPTVNAIHHAIENRYGVFCSDIVTADSISYFIRKLNDNSIIDPSRVKRIIISDPYLKSLSLLNSANHRRGRQILVSRINSEVDSEQPVRDYPIRQVAYSCRNHDIWGMSDIEAIHQEYNKIFSEYIDKPALRLVK